MSTSWNEETLDKYYTRDNIQNAKLKKYSKDKIQEMNYVHRNERKRQCLQKAVSESQLLIQRVTAEYDEQLSIERAKANKLHLELECLEQKLKSTTSTNTILKQQMTEKTNEVNDLHDQLKEAKIELSKLCSEAVIQNKQNQCLQDIKGQQFANNYSKTRPSTRHKQMELSVESYEQSFDQICQLQEAVAHLKKIETEPRKAETERDHVTTESENKVKTDENRIRSLEKEIEKSWQHQELHNCDERPMEVKGKHERRGKEKNVKEQKEELNIINSHEEESLSGLNGNNSTIVRQRYHDKNKQKQENLFSQEDVEKKLIENEEIINELTIENNNLKQKIKIELERNIKQRDLHLKADEEQEKNSTVKEKGNIFIHQGEKEQDFSSREVDGNEKESILTDEQNNIIYLNGQIEKRDQMLKALEENLESTRNKLKSEENLIDQIKQIEAKLFEQQIQLKTALSNLEENEAKLDDMKNERDFERQSRLDHEKTSRKNVATIKNLTSENNDFKQRIQSYEIDIKRRDIKLKAFKEKSKAEVDTKKEKDKILRKKDNQITKLEDQLQQVFARLKETEADLEETKIRLSKVMGDRLKDNNPNIADLSDENRPVKLAERYSELYDNQWTDAFDFLSKSIDSEQSTIEALLEILRDTMHFCIASASKQMEDLQGMLVFSNTSVGDIPVDVRLHLKNFRKALSKTAMRNLYENYILHMKQTAPDSFRSASEVKPYVQECFEICWLMSIQDPPVVFAPVAKQGSILDTNIYKPYTSSGTHVEYTVWPAMLLHEKGPILSKGVAQGRK